VLSCVVFLYVCACVSVRGREAKEEKLKQNKERKKYLRIVSKVCPEVQ
jgi:hypothetical protein